MAPKFARPPTSHADARVGERRRLPLGLVPTQAVFANFDRESLAHLLALNNCGPKQHVRSIGDPAAGYRLLPLLFYESTLIRVRRVALTARQRWKPLAASSGPCRETAIGWDFTGYRSPSNLKIRSVKRRRSGAFRPVSMSMFRAKTRSPR